MKLTEKRDDYKYLKDTVTAVGNWYEVRFDAEGNVSGIKENDGTKTVDGTSTNRTTLGIKDRIIFEFVNDKFITDVEDVRLATNGIPSHDVDGDRVMDEFTSRNDSLLLFSNFTCSNHNGAPNAVANLRFERERGTLYTDTGTSKGFTVDPNVKVVLTLSDKHGSDPFGKVVDTYEGWDGLEDALKALDCEQSAFDGFLGAVFANGRATSIILDDRSGSHTGVVEGAPLMTVNVTLMGPNGTLGTQTVRWNGVTPIESLVTPPVGYTHASTAAPTFIENGTGNATVTYTANSTMRVMVEFVTDLGNPGEAKVGQKAYTTVSDVNEDDIFTVADDLTIAAADYPTGYIPVTPANVSGDGGFFTNGGTITVKVEVEAGTMIDIKVDGTTKTVKSTAKVGDAGVTGFGNNGFVYAVDAAGNYHKGSDAVAAGTNYLTTNKYVKLSVTTNSDTVASKATGTLTAAKSVTSGIVDRLYAAVGSEVTVSVTVTSSEAGGDTLTGALSVAVASGSGEATVTKTTPAGDLIANGTAITATTGNTVDVKFTVALPDPLSGLTADTTVTVTVS